MSPRSSTSSVDNVSVVRGDLDGEVDVVAVDAAGNESVAVVVDLGAARGGGCNAGFDVAGVVALVALVGFRRL